MDNQCGPTEQHRELRSVFRGGLDERGVWGRMDQVCVWLSPFIVHLKLSQLCLLIYYTAIQNKKFKKLRFSDVPLMKIADGLPVACSLLIVGDSATCRLVTILLLPRSWDVAMRECSPAARHTTFNFIMAEGFGK